MAYAVDLHSGGTQSVFVPCGYVYGMGERAFRDRKLAAAHAFGAPRTAVVTTTSSGGSLSAACERHEAL
jgi:predicted deacylase